MNEKSIPHAGAYFWLIPHLIRIARERGYALGLHGSMNRDLDIIAVPWIKEAAPEEDLVAEIGRFIALQDKVTLDLNAKAKPEIKPHGRKGWALMLPGHGFYVDLSIMPRQL